MPPNVTRLHPERFDVLGPEGMSSTVTAPLFTYGSLQSPKVLQTLIGRIPCSTPDRLDGWRAARLEGRVYPGLVRSDGGVVDGLLVTGLTPEEWLLLDMFEGEDYNLEQLSLTNNTVAWAYVWTGVVKPETWSLADFTAVDLPAYLDACKAWLAHRIS